MQIVFNFFQMISGLVAIKQFYRYAAFRLFCYHVNSSGYYNKLLLLQKFCKHSGISYSTLRQDIKRFQADGLVGIHGAMIRFKRLAGDHGRLLLMYREFQSEIDRQENKPDYFASLVHRKEMDHHISKQAYKEAGKIDSVSARKSYLRIVHQTLTPLGAKQEIYLGMTTLSRVFDKSKATAWRYITKAEKGGVISVRRNTKFLGFAASADQYISIRNELRAYGRTFWNRKTGKVYMRLLNDYVL